MSDEPSALSGWTPEQIAQGKRWIETWRLAGADLEPVGGHRAECIDELVPIRRRQGRIVTHGLVVKRDCQPVLKQGTNDRAAHRGAHLPRGVENA